MIRLYQFPPAYGLSSASPFCMKVETWLRMTGLAYHPLLGDPRKAPKGKLPYIEDGDLKLGDSQLILDYLRAQYNVDPDAGLGAPQRALSMTITRMLEEHFYWVMLHGRWIDPQGWAVTREVFFGALPRPLREVVPRLVRRQLGRDLRGQGIGRHESPEIEAMGAEDMDALAILLGSRPFLLGDQAHSVDAVAHAFLAGTLAFPVDSLIKETVASHANLVAFVERMNAHFYPTIEPVP
ncbi:MAG TPA: glutathione S-transferase [Gammaproteobacteria bacterium]|jgi:glutathione S-transferase|nr:glutathione S-transferase [Gammaproteobacteria bacterium]